MANKPEQNPKAPTDEELLAEADLLEVEIPEGATREEIEKLLRDADSSLVGPEELAPAFDGESSADKKKREAKEKADAKKAEKAARKAEGQSEKEVTYRIKTPVEGFNGKSRGVSFSDGVGETTNEWYAQRCRDAGYEVTEA